MRILLSKSLWICRGAKEMNHHNVPLVGAQQSAKPPSYRQQLTMTRARMTKKIEEIDNLLALLDENPIIDKFVELTQKYNAGE